MIWAMENVSCIWYEQSGFVEGEEDDWEEKRKKEKEIQKQFFFLLFWQKKKNWVHFADVAFHVSD